MTTAMTLDELARTLVDERGLHDGDFTIEGICQASFFDQKVFDAVRESIAVLTEQQKLAAIRQRAQYNYFKVLVALHGWPGGRDALVATLIVAVFRTIKAAIPVDNQPGQLSGSSQTRPA